MITRGGSLLGIRIGDGRVCFPISENIKPSTSLKLHHGTLNSCQMLLGISIMVRMVQFIPALMIITLPLKKILLRLVMRLVEVRIRSTTHGQEVSGTCAREYMTLSIILDHLGFYSSLAAVDRSSDVGKRSYAATAYLRPNLGRPNLRVLTDALATKIVLDGNVASGVDFVHNGQTYRIEANKEVICSAGTIQTPQLLELSGIGDPTILEKAGVKCMVENKRVGYGFQDHVLGKSLQKHHHYSC